MRILNTIIKVLLIAELLIITGVLIYKAYLVIRKREGESYSPILGGLLGIATGAMTAVGLDGSEFGRNVLEEDLEDKNLIRNTLLVGLTGPISMAAILFVNLYKIETRALLLLGVSGILGALASYGLKITIKETKVREYISFVLLVMGGMLLYQKFTYINGPNISIVLKSSPLFLGMIGNFILGIVVAQGISIFTPTLGMYVFLGITPRSAYTIMFLALSLLLPFKTTKIIKEGKYYKKTALFISLLGCLGAYYGFGFFKNQTIEIVRWILIISMVAAGITNLLQSIVKENVEVDVEVDVDIDSNIKTELNK